MGVSSQGEFVICQRLLRGQGSGDRSSEGDCKRSCERNLGNIGTLQGNIVTGEEEEGSLERLAASWPGCGTGRVLHLHFPAVQNLGRGALAEMVLGAVFTGLI